MLSSFDVVVIFAICFFILILVACAVAFIRFQQDKDLSAKRKRQRNSEIERYNQQQADRAVQLERQRHTQRQNRQQCLAIVCGYIMKRSPRYTFLSSVFEKYDIPKSPPNAMRVDVCFSTKREFDNFDPRAYVTRQANFEFWAEKDGKRAVTIRDLLRQAPDFLSDDEIDLVYFMVAPKMSSDMFHSLWRATEREMCVPMSLGGFSPNRAVEVRWRYVSPKGRNSDSAHICYDLDTALSMAFDMARDISDSYGEGTKEYSLAWAVSESKKAPSISSVDGMEGHAFERWCAELLTKCGFSHVNVTKGSGDQGVDVIGVYGGEKWAVQCKNYAKPLGNKPIQEVVSGAMFYDCSRRAVMTNQTFTKGAKELAKKTETVLIDRKTIARMLNYVVNKDGQ